MSTKFLLFFIIFIDMVAVVTAVLIGEKPSQHFKELGLITWLSFIQLLLASVIAWKIFKRRSKGGQLKDWNQSHVLWAIIAFGFLFLAIDEVARIHEGMDKLIHMIFGIQQTALTDRIDDVILGCYGLLGLWIRDLYREEIKNYREVLPLLGLGFIFLFVMVVLDFVSEKADIVSIFIKDPSASGRFNSWLGITEEVFKILAEAVFIAAFYDCLKITRNNQLNRLKVKEI